MPENVDQDVGFGHAADTVVSCDVCSKFVGGREHFDCSFSVSRRGYSNSEKFRLLLGAKQ